MNWKTQNSELIKQRPFFDDLIKRKFVFAPTAEIYGGVAGLFDYGPLGATIKQNFINIWRKHFVMEEDFLEVPTTTLTPQIVFKHPGHEDRFNDFMVKDNQTKETFRADHLLESILEQKINNKQFSEQERVVYEEMLRSIPNFQSSADFEKLFEKLDVRNPTHDKNKLRGVYPFNLMFSTKIGPMGDQLAYFRPETAQSIFVNFKRLLEFKNGKLPFGASCIGNAYRNEIAPRNGLLRVREFEMAEIEYFIDPEETSFSKFNEVSSLIIPLLGRDEQTDGKDIVLMSLDDAVKKNRIQGEVLAYYIGRTWLFALAIGLKSDHLRFRQHCKGEMAHYARDCWDLEVLSSFGWIECVGLADRSAYDLNAHSKGSDEKLVASRIFETPQEREQIIIEFNRASIGKTFRTSSKAVMEFLDSMSIIEAKDLKDQMCKNGKATVLGCEITKEMVPKLEIEKVMIQEEKYTPYVIEPSFGIGRLIYCLLEQSFRMREDVQRTYFYFTPAIAPYKIVFLSLINKKELVDQVISLENEYRKAGYPCKSDYGSSAIGKRYARTDELGIPFGVTVDFQTLEDKTVTLRDLISTKQIRIPINQLKTCIDDAINEKTTFIELSKIYKEVKINPNDKSSS